MDLYTLPNVKLIASGKQPHWHREISSVLCDHLEGWDREGERETKNKKQKKGHEEPSGKMGIKTHTY